MAGIVYINPPSGRPITYPDIESACDAILAICDADSRADRHLNSDVDSDRDVGPSGDVGPASGRSAG